RAFARQFLGHLKPVQAVAVSKDARQPLIVAAGEDRTVRVWDRMTGEQKPLLRHPVAVGAVACTAPTASDNYCLSGADDGGAGLWDRNNLPPDVTPLKELKGHHRERIVSVAFAPEGKYCATADANVICLWDVASGDLRYKFPTQHRGPITFIQFTPQSRLVS